MKMIGRQPNFWLQDFENELFPVMSKWFGNETATPSIQNWAPRVDVKEEKDRYLAFVDLPGVDSKDIDIEMDGHTLTIKGERKAQNEDQSENYFRIERAHGKFCRQFSLPDTIDSKAIEAKTKQGVLTIILPKLVAPTTQKIEIQEG